jgi:hypothetical protein
MSNKADYCGSVAPFVHHQFWIFKAMKDVTSLGTGAIWQTLEAP